MGRLASVQQQLADTAVSSQAQAGIHAQGGPPDHHQPTLQVHQQAYQLPGWQSQEGQQPFARLGAAVRHQAPIIHRLATTSMTSRAGQGTAPPTAALAPPATQQMAPQPGPRNPYLFTGASYRAQGPQGQQQQQQQQLQQHFFPQSEFQRPAFLQQQQGGNPMGYGFDQGTFQYGQQAFLPGLWQQQQQ
jgi:hypothetical protein